MRVMVKFTFPTQESNALVEDGSIGQTMQALLGNLQHALGAGIQTVLSRHGST